MGLGMSQVDFAAAGGVLKNAQSNYEKDKRVPDVQYLVNVAKIGVDINYLITGYKPSDNEMRLLSVIRHLTAEQQQHLEKFLASLNQED